MMELDKRLVKIVPSERQLSYQQLEFYAFVHFTVNTFTGKEWGDGTEAPAIFHPDKLDARQWTKALKVSACGPASTPLILWQAAPIVTEKAMWFEK